VSASVIVDTGPLVAFLADGSEHGPWVTERFKQLRPPLLTCEAVLTEAAFLLKREGADADKLFALVERGVLRLDFSLRDHLSDVRELMRRYRDTPMSLADGCLVRMAEIHDGATVFSLDGDFRIYRKHGRRIIPVLMPGD
jgi:predicted nucleic acid-binding protein